MSAPAPQNRRASAELEPPTRATPLADAVCLTALALALCIPFFGRRLDPEADRSTLPEQRNPAPYPNLAADPLAFPGRFDAWLGDHYGFRGELVRWHNRAVLLGFGTSPTERLVAGPGPWLFTTGNRALEAYRGSFQLTASDLDAWTRAVRERRDWLAERGARYLLALAPGKPSIYGERLPAGYAPGERTPLDQLAEHLRRELGFELVDLRPPLAVERASDRPAEGDYLYYPLGTHWTERGAFVACRELLTRARRELVGFADLAPPRAEDYRSVPLEDQGDSWAGRLRLSGELSQRTYGFVPRGARRSRTLLEETHEQVFETDLDAPRVVLLHDSFGDLLREQLREHCGRLYTLASTDFESELIERERPQLVVQLMAERRLASYRPPSSSLGGDAAARLAFEAAGSPLFTLDRAAAALRLDPWRRATLTPAQGPDDPALRVHLRRAGDGLLLPELELPAGHAPVLRIDVELPAAGELALFYQTPGSPEYLPVRRVAVELPAGRSVAHLDLAVADATGRFLVLPGGTRGDCLVRGLELRARPLE